MGDTKKRGRPATELTNALEAKRAKTVAAHVPPREVCIDGINHMPLWAQNRLACKIPGCGKRGYVKCKKCEVTLCFNKDRNCFIKFHESS